MSTQIEPNRKFVAQGQKLFLVCFVFIMFCFDLAVSFRFANYSRFGFISLWFGFTLVLFCFGFVSVVLFLPVAQHFPLWLFERVWEGAMLTTDLNVFQGSCEVLKGASMTVTTLPDHLPFYCIQLFKGRITKVELKSVIIAKKYIFVTKSNMAASC